MRTLILRCSDGHLFTANWLKLVLLSVHLGSSVWTRCPVDHKWRVAARTPSGTLSDTELGEAKQHRF